jgi:hypothetical protein
MAAIKFAKTYTYDEERSKAHPDKGMFSHSRGRWISADHLWYFSRSSRHWRIACYDFQIVNGKDRNARKSFLLQTGLYTARFPSRKEAAAALALALEGSDL